LKVTSFSFTSSGKQSAESTKSKTTMILIDATFVFNDKFFTVNHSEGIRVFAVCNGDGEQLSFSHDVLWDIILT
jgi:hypothetical protein